MAKSRSDGTQSREWRIPVHFRWQEPDDKRERAFDAALPLHSGHELNVLTFATCVNTATRPEIDSAGSAAIGALKGRRTANKDVIAILLQAVPPTRRSST
jgi:citrate synthase